MKVLVLNSGSSSLKFQLINSETEEVLAKGQCDRIGMDGGNFTYKGAEKYKIDADMENHEVALKILFDALTDKDKGAIKSVDEIDAIGHRVVHGGEKYSDPVLVTDKVLADIEELSSLAPLHNPANAMGIKACMSMTKAPQVAVFDTAFHQTMPQYAYMYGVPYKYYEENGVRRYGFHGTSHKFVSKAATEWLEKEFGIKAEDSKVITCHLGNGSSIAAVKGGKVIDTSMGLTPEPGLLMGTRAGDVDPSAITFIMEKCGVSPEEMDKIINKKSGLLGISGQSSDMRDIIEGKGKGCEKCQLAFDMLVYSIKKFIGAYAAAMGGVDMIVFTGGIGENSEPVRKAVLTGMEYLGVELDGEKNKVMGEKADITVKGDGKAVVIPTNEELMIALETVSVVNG
ncbi:MAG: acetate kinase [Armatimonadetes bacterium]|nr:acetate kinase [Candidatus Hippobium faecium]